MTPSGRGQPARKARPAPRLQLAPQEPQFDFLASKVQIPTLRPGMVSRAGLVNRLRAAASIPVVTAIAPAGYGKTTALSQWAARDPRPLAWVTIDDRDNDPVVLLRHVAAALAQLEPVPERLVRALRSPGPSLWVEAVPRLAAELRAREPLVLVLDDVHLLRSRASLEAVAALMDDEATGSMLVLAGRVQSRLSLAPLRASGRLFELGMEDLALSNREAQLLLRATDVRLGAARTAELVEQCEGWAAALYLAALSIRDGKQDARTAGGFGGDDRYLADYFRSEYLSQLRPGPLRFLRRTALLERMSGPLCDALLDDVGSERELEKIERANLFLVPLDSRREWYRYHHLFRDLLLRELQEAEPELVPLLHRRAADWFEAHGDRESALEHAFFAGDTDRAASILAEITRPLYYSGRVETVERWLKRFERAGLLDRYPMVAVHGCGLHLMRGRREDAARWLAAAERTHETEDGASVRPWIATIRAWMCVAGAEEMLTDAEAALAELPPESGWRPSALLAQGVALTLLGQTERGGDAVAEAAATAGAAGAGETRVIALSMRALLLAREGDHVGVEELAGEARRLVADDGVQGFPPRAIEHAVSAHVLVRSGQWNEARETVLAARELLPAVTDAVPWLAVQARLELARTLLTLRDAELANELLSEIEDICKRCPELGTLPVEAAALQREIDELPEVAGAASAGLTPAELRLLPLLASHLSFREIAEQLYVSRNTIKTQAISVYRKLGASSRSEAIAKAHELGLGEHLRVLVSNERGLSP